MTVLGLIAIYLAGGAYVFYSLNFGTGKKAVLEVELNRKRFLTATERVLYTSLLSFFWPVLLCVGAYWIARHFLRKI